MTAPTSPTDHAISEARERIRLPGIFLVIVGVLNLIVAGLILVPSIQLVGMTNEELKGVAQEAEEHLKQLFPGGRPTGLSDWGKDARGIQQMRAQIALSAAGGVVMLLFASLSIVGGWRMVQLRGRGLAILGSALVTIPCLSPLGCCLVGEVVGLWSLVVLFNADVTAAFAARKLSLSEDAIG